MNKQQAIKTAEFRVIYPTEVLPSLEVLPLEEVKNIISQIDEPQKPVVPKFVADFYESIKDDFEWGLYKLCVDFNKNERELQKDLNEWFECDANKPIETLVKMELYGYEVEKEKLYTVEIPDPHGIYKIRYLFRNGVGNIRIEGSDYRDIFLNVETHLTESEIKQDFEFLWQFAKEVE